MKFLVIQQKMIGDVLASTILCESLKHYFPESEVHFVANQNTLPVLQNNPFIDQVVVFKNEYRKNKGSFYKFLKAIRNEKYHAVIDAYGKLESNLVSLFTKSKFKITHLKWYTSWIYTHTVKENLKPNGTTPLALENRLALLGPLLEGLNEFAPRPKLFLTETEILDAKKSMASVKEYPDQKMIMISILGSNSLKTYPTKYMAEVLDYIGTQTDAKMLFNYIPGQAKEAKVIYEACNELTKSRIALDFYAPSLRKFIALLSQCSALIGNEGGAVNMAKALDVPTFCIFSPFIIKGAWHTSMTETHTGVHLADYHPELLGNGNKHKIKKNSVALYEAFEPTLFKERLGNFLKQFGH